MNKTCKYLVAGLALPVLMWSAAGRAADALTVEDAWVREAPPHLEMSAAYLTIKNETSQDHTLVGVSSPQFQKVEIHSTRMMNGMVHMQMMKEVAIAAHNMLEFKPGAYHLMMIQPLHPLKAGEKVELTLKFNDVPPVTVQAPIRNADNDEEAPHHHDMDDMKM
jgi:copper(I)-binding protein